jgi:O-antigen/teichoic acid export membrane protein
LRIGRFGRHPDVMRMATVVLVKIMMVALNFAFIAVAARALNIVGFGNYSILFSAAGLLSVVAVAGQELFVIRSWNEFALAGDAARTKGLLWFSFALAAGATAIVAGACYPWARWSFDADTALAVTLFLAFGAILQISCHLLRTAVSVAAGDGAGALLQTLPAIVYIGVCLAFGGAADLATVFAFLAFGSAAGIALHFLLMRRLLHRLFPDIHTVPIVINWKEWSGRSVRLWGANILEAVNQYSDVLIIGYLVSPAIAGAYFVIVKLANVFAAAADSINLFATSRFSALYHKGADRELDDLLNSVAWTTLLFVGCGMVGVAGGGYLALLLINEAYAVYFPELLILCLGTAALAMAQPCGSILMLTGHEDRYAWIIAGSVVMRVLGLFIMIPPFGIMGAVTATAVSFIATAVVLRQSAKSATGLDPSIARLFKRAGRRG